VNVAGTPFRTIWPDSDGATVSIIDQTLLPHRFATVRLTTLDDAVCAIRTMQVRGAPLIGATAAYGLALGLRADATDQGLAQACSLLLAARPTAVNLRWAIERVRHAVASLPPEGRFAAALATAAVLCDEDVALNRAIADHGATVLAQLAAQRSPGARLNVLTHCNAGWLATVDLGTALAPVYRAHDRGLALHVWVDETRPRNQGASLTAWELGQHGVPHTVVADNAGGHLMQQGSVDCVLVGADRVAANGDVGNKIGTYLKALAAHDTGVPFYVALPGPTIDWTCATGRAIPVEERSAREVTHLSGIDAAGRVVEVRVTPPGSNAVNPAFDVTPARLVTAFITERGVARPTADGLLSLFPEHRPTMPRSAPPRDWIL
jgi:methylthioribose-1-phosphate isomerase